jgi:8-oxo-dGTP diphosphatase
VAKSKSVSNLCLSVAKPSSVTCPRCGARHDLYRQPVGNSVVCPNCHAIFEVEAHRFCPLCGAGLERRSIDGRERPACPRCDYVLYGNPLPGVAVVVVHEGRVLLGRRRGSPFEGQWCIPCGYVEADEDVRDAARREFREETGLRVELGRLYAIHSNFQVAARPVIGIWFLAKVIGGEMEAGDDLAELRFFPIDAPPPDLAFEGDRLVIEQLRQEARR